MGGYRAALDEQHAFKQRREQLLTEASKLARALPRAPLREQLDQQRERIQRLQPDNLDALDAAQRQCDALERDITAARAAAEVAQLGGQKRLRGALVLVFGAVMLLMLIGARTAYDSWRYPCAVRCAAEGLCTVEAGECVATETAQCLGSAACQDFGHCAAHFGVCEARTNDDCARSRACWRDQLCYARDGGCGAPFKAFDHTSEALTHRPRFFDAPYGNGSCQHGIPPDGERP